MRFILDNTAEDVLQEKDESVRMVTSKAGAFAEQAKANAHRMIDIKGQI